MTENYEDLNKAQLENVLIERDMEDDFTTKSTKEELIELLEQADAAAEGSAVAAGGEVEDSGALSNLDEHNAALVMGLQVAVQQLQTQKTVSGGNTEYDPAIQFLQDTISERQSQG